MKQFEFYKTGSVMILLWSFVMIFGCINIREIAYAHTASNETYEEEEVSSRSVSGELVNSTSGQRIMNVSMVDKEYVLEITPEDYENMLRIVEAEAGGEDRMGKLLVANVIINRVKDDAFPDSVTDVVFQQENGVCQFSPIRDGRFYTVSVSEETVEAVEAALLGEDCSKGALYFMARKAADKDRAAWFDRNLTKLFTYGGHEFFC
ncbi:MAG: cell wall hydrolase [Lachnospiraceae bacterium]|nr:cell wall hydrolase [Lachnospiraceae bacterium]